MAGLEAVAHPNRLFSFCTMKIKSEKVHINAFQNTNREDNKKGDTKTVRGMYRPEQREND